MSYDYVLLKIAIFIDVPNGNEADTETQLNLVLLASGLLQEREHKVRAKMA